jgi:hypothetical protein
MVLAIAVRREQEPFASNDGASAPDFAAQVPRSQVAGPHNPRACAIIFAND